MPERYWLVLPNGARQHIDPHEFDIDDLAQRAGRIGARLVVEALPAPRDEPRPRGFEPPLSALGPIFRTRLSGIYESQHPFELDMNPRPTTRMLGGYYRRRKLVRVYTHDKVLGRRPVEELFDTFLHEVAHHLEYTEPKSFHAPACQRVKGTMHSPLFWRILGELKWRWAERQK